MGFSKHLNYIDSSTLPIMVMKFSTEKIAPTKFYNLL